MALADLGGVGIAIIQKGVAHRISCSHPGRVQLVPGLRFDLLCDVPPQDSMCLFLNITNFNCKKQCDITKSLEDRKKREKLTHNPCMAALFIYLFPKSFYMQILLPDGYIYKYLVLCMLFPVNIIPKTLPISCFYFQLYRYN